MRRVGEEKINRAYYWRRSFARCFSPNFCGTIASSFLKKRLPDYYEGKGRREGEWEVDREGGGNEVPSLA